MSDLDKAVNIFFREDVIDGIRTLDVEKVKERLRARMMLRYRSLGFDLENIEAFEKRLTFTQSLDVTYPLEDDEGPLRDAKVTFTVDDSLGILSSSQESYHVLVPKEM